MPSEARIFLAGDEPYARYGLVHFAQKFGLVVADGKSLPDIRVGYGANGTPETARDISLSALEADPPQDPRRLLGLVKKLNVERNSEEIRFDFDIFGEIGRILGGYYDRCFLEDSKAGAELRRTPVVDIFEQTLISTLCKIMPGLEYSSFAWPESRSFALVLTHDVDRVYKTYQYLASFWRAIRNAKPVEFIYHLKNLLFNHDKKNPYWTFAEVREVEDALGVKSTFYFLNETGRHNPFSLKSWILFKGVYDIEQPDIARMIRTLSESDFEIGVHGSYRSYNDTALLESEKRSLEAIINKEIAGVRQHYLNYDQGVTPYVHRAAGFKYDTSVGFKPAHGAIGFRRGTSFPFRLLLPDLTISPMLELPLIIMDSALENGTAIKDCIKLMDSVEQHHGVLTILWHSNKLNPFEFPDCTRHYFEIITEAKRRNAWITTAGRVCDWIAAVDGR